MRASPKSLSQPDNDGNLPFHFACKHGNVTLVKTMERADLRNQKNDAGRTSLHFAVEGNKMEIVNYLISLPGVDINQRTETQVIIFKS